VSKFVAVMAVAEVADDFDTEELDTEVSRIFGCTGAEDPCPMRHAAVTTTDTYGAALKWLGVK
jgi:hypothetical protein